MDMQNDLESPTRIKLVSFRVGENNLFCSSSSRRNENTKLPRLDFGSNWLRDEQVLIDMGVNKSLMVTKITHGYPVQQLRVPDLRKL